MTKHQEKKMKDFFTAKDFEDSMTDEGYPDVTPQCAADMANAKLNALIESWPVVYAKQAQKDENGNDVNFWKTFQHFGVDTYKARLAFIEEIVKTPCLHEPNLLNQKIGGWFCKHCGVELVAEWKAK